MMLAFVAFMMGVGCSREGRDRSAENVRLMELASPRTEIVLRSSQVPGYWAKDVTDGTRCFLFLWAPGASYGRGDVLAVQGGYGEADAVVFDDETRVYQRDLKLSIFVAWQARKRVAGGPTP